MNIIGLIVIIAIIWAMVCVAKIITKEIICKDCILKKECDEHCKQTGKTFCDNHELNNYFNDFFKYPLA